jgi:predicted Fe-Mo cluster-binding NifX family protein
MKAAITAQGSSMDSPVDPRFGRARYFLVADTETGEFTAHDNSQNLNAVQGAGIQAAQNVTALGVEAVVTGHVGPKAFRTLQAAGIKVYVGASGSVADAVAALKAGRLEGVDRPDVQAHWL